MRISDWSSDVCSSDLVHYRIVTTLHDEGRLSDGAYMEFLQTHTNVVYQPMFDTPGYNGINPYALGFGMMTDIERICTDPTEEDREWFPDIAGSQEPMEVLKHIWAHYRRKLHRPVPQPAPDPPQIVRATCREIRCHYV